MLLSRMRYGSIPHSVHCSDVKLKLGKLYNLMKIQPKYLNRICPTCENMRENIYIVL